jgi:hypothetical protein
MIDDFACDHTYKWNTGYSCSLYETCCYSKENNPNKTVRSSSEFGWRQDRVCQGYEDMKIPSACDDCYKRLVYPKCSLFALSWERDHPHSAPKECPSKNV